MSGIAGSARFDGGPVEPSAMRRMLAALAHRGPDGQGVWTGGHVGLAHALLRTTEEAVEERQPLVSDDESIVLVFDGWLQNWLELRSTLVSRGVTLRTRADSELVLRAYEIWGQACAEHLHGDFAFVVWDSRRNQAFCVRDRIGMRPFYYYHAPGSGFAFASDPEALLTLPGIPRALNEGRIADSLVGDLEGYDHTSSFYAGISRLPPAHQMVVSQCGVQISRYWRMEPPKPCRLGSDAEYADAFAHVLKDAVRCRMRGGTGTAAMLSGGLDSSSIVATARTIAGENGALPFRTVSAVGPDPNSCSETQAIRAVIASGGLEPHLVDYSTVTTQMPELTALSLSPPTPFDTHMTLVRAVYLAAHKAGLRAVLDGVGGDLVLGDGGQVPYLIRRGRWLTAISELRASGAFWSHPDSIAARLLQAARPAVTPDWARRASRAVGWSRRKWRRRIEESLINPDFADRVCLLDRFEKAAAYNSPASYRPGSARQRLAGIFHAHNTAARERYEREAARLGIEPRDPFFDIRVIEFCVSLPVEQTARHGWTKYILRNAMRDKLPDDVRWRRGKSHLGWQFTRAVMDQVRDQFVGDDVVAQLDPFISRRRLIGDWETYRDGGFPDERRAKLLTRVLLMSRWLANQIEK